MHFLLLRKPFHTLLVHEAVSTIVPFCEFASVQGLRQLLLCKPFRLVHEAVSIVVPFFECASASHQHGWKSSLSVTLQKVCCVVDNCCLV